jgi:hypothetical protein
MRTLAKTSIIAIALGVSVSNAEDKPMAQYILEAYDGLCVQNADDFRNIDHMAKALGARELPNDLQQGDPAMRNNGGKSYMLLYEDVPLIVAYANGGGCTVVAQDIDHANLASLLEENLGAIFKHTDRTGTQVTDYYQIEDNSSRDGAIISLVYGREGSGWTEGSVSFLPAQLAKPAVR